jgi:hypothetical protein
MSSRRLSSLGFMLSPNQVCDSSAADKYTSYCQTIDGTTCKEPTSLIRYFDGTYASINPIFNDPTFRNIPEVLFHK